MHSDRPSKCVPKHDYKSQKWQRHSRQQLIMSAFLAAFEKSLERSGDGWLATRHANLRGLYRRLKIGNPTGGQQSAHNQLV